MSTTEIVKIEDKTVLAAFSNGDGLDSIINQARDVVSSFNHNLETDAGRKKTASLAAKVSRLKTRLDGMGKELVSGWKAQAKAVDANRKAMRDALDELKKEARAPLDEWEKEQIRIATEKLKAEEAEKLAKQIESDHEIGLLLNEKFDRELKEAEERAEAARVAAEQARQKEIEEAKARAAEEAKKQAEKEAEERAAKLEQDRLMQIKRAEDAERAKIAAEERAKVAAEQAEMNRIAAEKRAKEEAELAAERAKAEQIRLQQEKEAKEKADIERREANKRHVSTIRREAKESLMLLGIDEVTAKKVVLAIHNGDIENVKIEY